MPVQSELPGNSEPGVQKGPESEGWMAALRSQIRGNKLGDAVDERRVGYRQDLGARQPGDGQVVAEEDVADVFGAVSVGPVLSDARRNAEHRLKCIDELLDGSVAVGVHAQLESGPVHLAHNPPEIPVFVAELSGDIRIAFVGLSKGGGPCGKPAVDEQLDPSEPEPRVIELEVSDLPIKHVFQGQGAGHVDIDAQSEGHLAGVYELPHRPEARHGLGHLLDGGDAVGQETVVDGASDGILDRFVVGHRDWEPVIHVLHAARGLAGGVSFDDSALGVGGIRGDTCDLQHFAVEYHHMVAGLEQDGMIDADAVEVMPVGVALFPEAHVLKEAALGDNPLAFWHACGVLAEGGEDVLDTLVGWGVATDGEPEAQAREFQVSVGVVETGHEGPTSQVYEAGTITLGRQHFFRRTYGRNLVASHRRGLGDRVLRVDG